MKIRLQYILFTLIFIFSISGLFRLRFNTDLTSVLPSEVAQVEAVQSFHQYFQDDHQIVVFLQCPEDKVYGEDLEQLAEFFQEYLPDSELVLESSYERDTEVLAAALARMWLLSAHEYVVDYVHRITDEEQLRSHLKQLKEEVRKSFSSGKAIAHSYDPFGFMQHAGIVELGKADYSFESDDGEAHFFFIKRKGQAVQEGYKADAEWIAEVKQVLALWNEEQDGLFTFGLTGGPVYNSEVGVGLEHDMMGTVGVTLALIALLFLLLQRSIKQLLVLVALVALTFFLTLGMAGWIMPQLNVLSISFAAILLGLVIDYAVVLLRESCHFPPDRAIIRQGLRKGILWAAFTTSLVFSILLISSFPGVRQLGVLIVIGLIYGAVIMLWGVPLFVERVQVQPTTQIWPWRVKGSSKALLLLPVFLLVTASGILLWKGNPSFQFSLQSIQPEKSEAATVQEALEKRFSSWSELRTVVFAEAHSSQELERKLVQAARAAEELVKKGYLRESHLPANLVPHEDSYERNYKVLQALVLEWESMCDVAREEGFTASAVQFDQAVVNTLKEMPSLLSEFQTLPPLNFLTKGIITEQDGRHYFRGSVVLKEPLSTASLSQMNALNSNGVTLTGWGVLNATLEPIVRSDFKRIFLPAALIILLGLGAVFRSVKETLLVLFILLTSTLCVNAYMVVAGLEWNFLNCIAFPLIIGIGIDYSIHLIFALRRAGEKEGVLWDGVGVAILFCGLSSVIGFGSLTVAHTPLLCSLGLVCAVGVFVTMVLSLVVIPSLWRRWCT